MVRTGLLERLAHFASKALASACVRAEPLCFQILHCESCLCPGCNCAWWRQLLRHQRVRSVVPKQSRSRITHPPSADIRRTAAYLHETGSHTRKRYKPFEAAPSSYCPMQDAVCICRDSPTARGPKPCMGLCKQFGPGSPVFTEPHACTRACRVHHNSSHLGVLGVPPTCALLAVELLSCILHGAPCGWSHSLHADDTQRLLHVPSMIQAPANWLHMKHGSMMHQHPGGRFRWRCGGEAWLCFLSSPRPL